VHLCSDHTAAIVAGTARVAACPEPRPTGQVWVLRRWDRHEDEVTLVPDGFRVLARTPGCEVQALAAPERRWWGTQFHAECFDAEHPDGERVLRNFFRLADA